MILSQFCLFLLGFASLCLADTRLVQEIAVYRHGHRYPLHYLSPQLYHYPEPFVPGDLTARGAWKHYVIGREQRESLLFNSRLTNAPEALELLTQVYTTTARRTTATAGAHMAGLLGLESLPKLAPMLLSSSYSRAGNLPHFKDCTTLKSWLKQRLLDHGDEIQSQHKELAKKVSEMTGRAVETVQDWEEVAGTVAYAEAHYLMEPVLNMTMDEISEINQIREQRMRLKFGFKRWLNETIGSDRAKHCPSHMGKGMDDDFVCLGRVAALQLSCELHLPGVPECDAGMAEVYGKLTDEVKQAAKIQQMFAGGMFSRIYESLNRSASSPGTPFEALAAFRQGMFAQSESSPQYHSSLKTNVPYLESVPPLYSFFSTHDSALMLLLESLGLVNEALGPARTPSLADSLHITLNCQFSPNTSGPSIQSNSYGQASYLTGDFSACVIEFLYNQRHISVPSWMYAMAGKTAQKNGTIPVEDFLLVTRHLALPDSALYGQVCGASTLLPGFTQSDREPESTSTGQKCSDTTIILDCSAQEEQVKQLQGELKQAEANLRNLEAERQQSNEQRASNQVSTTYSTQTESASAGECGLMRSLVVFLVVVSGCLLLFSVTLTVIMKRFGVFRHLPSAHELM